MAVNFLAGFLALGTGSASFAELYAPGYVRQPVALSPLISGVSYALSNETFVAAAQWPTVTQVGVMDAAGNLLMWWNRSEPFTLGAGSSHTTSAFTFSFPDLRSPPPNAAILLPAGSPVATMANGNVVRAGSALQFAAGTLSASITPTLAGISNKMLPLCRQRPCSDGLNYIASGSSSNTGNARSFFFAPANSAVTDIVLRFPGFYEGQPEANNLLAYTVTASIEYPIGTFTQVTFGGSTAQIVTPGKVIYSSDPCPVYIPAGAKAAVKTFFSWTTGVANLVLASLGNNGCNGEWWTVGVGVADHTMDATVLTTSFTVGAGGRGVGSPGFAIYGQLASAVPIVGLIGDSITQGVKDFPDPVYGGLAVERGLRSQLPVVNVARQAETFATYQTRTDGRNRLLVNACTHLLFFMGRNDVSAALTSAQIQAALVKAINPYLARGMKVWTATVTPISTSSDAWATSGNQAVQNAGQDVNRLAYNAFLRSSYASVGLSGVFDWAHVVDPGDTGIWLADGTAGKSAVGVPTLTGTALTSVALAPYAGNAGYGGTGYPVSQAALPCVVTRYPDDPIRTNDAVVTCATDGTGAVTSYTVVSGGAYSIPPMVCPVGQWTDDGTHPTYRAYNAIIAATGFSPASFVLF